MLDLSNYSNVPVVVGRGINNFNISNVSATVSVLFQANLTTTSCYQTYFILHTLLYKHTQHKKVFQKKLSTLFILSYVACRPALLFLPTEEKRLGKSGLTQTLGRIPGYFYESCRSALI